MFEGKALDPTYNWYSLNPGGDKNRALDYTKVMNEPTCRGDANVCAVHALDDGNAHPQGIPSSGAVTTNQFIDQVDHKN